MKLEDKRCGEALVITVRENRLDAAGAVQFEETLGSHIDGGEKTILLNLSEVDFIDSSGLGALVAVLKRISPTGKLVVCGLRDAASNMFRLTRMDKVFPLFPDEDEALNALGA